MNLKWLALLWYHFYISDKYDNILVASFSFDNTSASLIYTETEHKTDNMTKLYLHKSTLYYMNYDHTSTNITFSKLTNNSQCSISCFEQKFHSVSADNLYQKLLMKYAKFLELYGNFDIKKYLLLILRNNCFWFWEIIAFGFEEYYVCIFLANII